MFGRKSVQWGLVALALIYIFLAIVGGFKSYSPVPLADMWGALDFYVKASNGDVHAWWAQHNEHRIVLARALFWLDLKIFNGEGPFLIVVNYLLVGLIFLVEYLALKEMLRDEKDKFTRYSLGLIILCLMFSWIQSENLNWSFQSQFFAAYLLPLAACFLLHKAHSDVSNSSAYFLAACAAGVLSAGTMANGVLALPLMTLLAALLRMGWRRVIVLAFLAALTNLAYFHDYQAPAHHGSLRDALLHNPLGLLEYTLLYIGGPFYYASRESKAVAMLSAAFLIVSAAFFFRQAVKSPSRSSLQLVLLTFLLYVGGTAFGTGGGRLIFGVEQALSSRYMTPALSAWATLLVLYAPAIARNVAPLSARAFALLALPFLFLPPQLHALDSHRQEQFEKKVAALALALGIPDQSQIQTVFPAADWAVTTAKIPAQKQFSIFADPSIRNALQLLGQKDAERSSNQCKGSLDEISDIANDQHFVRIRGWLVGTNPKAVPVKIHILDQERRIVGYALAGQEREDVAKAVHPDARWTGFKGYLLADQAAKRVTIKGLALDCELDVTVAAESPFHARAADFRSGDRAARYAQVINGDWTGTDFQRTNIEGYRILGSFIRSDQDTGSISLTLHRGDTIFYRSGPTGGRQRISIDPDKNYLQTLPVATDWIALEFSDADLPDTFTIKLTDAGNGWGEWSAIALRK